MELVVCNRIEDIRKQHNTSFGGVSFYISNYPDDSEVPAGGSHGPVNVSGWVSKGFSEGTRYKEWIAASLLPKTDGDRGGRGYKVYDFSPHDGHFESGRESGYAAVGKETPGKYQAQDRGRDQRKHPGTAVGNVGAQFGLPIGLDRLSYEDSDQAAEPLLGSSANQCRGHIPFNLFRWSLEYFEARLNVKQLYLDVIQRERTKQELDCIKFRTDFSEIASFSNANCNPKAISWKLRSLWWG